MQLTIDQINAMDRTEFVKTFGGIFENSPWVAERTWAERPFADPNTLHAAMCAVVRSAPIEEQLTLLRAHPDLAGKEAQAGTMTDHSVSEQASAGLNALTKMEMARIAQLNSAYRAKHGFPFIIAVRRHTKDSIFQEFERRLHNENHAELGEDLSQVFIITALRLQALVGG